MRKWLLFIFLLVFGLCYSQEPFEKQWEVDMGDKDINAMVNMIVVGDYDNDLKNEVVVALTVTGKNIGDVRGRIVVLSESGNIESKWDVSTPAFCVGIGDVNGDKKNEIVAGSLEIGIYNSSGVKISSFAVKAPIYDAAVFDFDSDGIDEIVFGTKDFGVILLDEGIEKWKTDVGGPVKHIEILEDRIAVSTDRYIYFLDFDGRKIENFPYLGGIANISYTGNKILFSSRDRKIYYFTTPITLFKDTKYYVAEEIFSADLDLDGENELVVGGDNLNIYVFFKDREWSYKLREEDPIDEISSLYVEDVDKDGLKDIVFGTKIKSQSSRVIFLKNTMQVSAENIFQEALEYYSKKEYEKALELFEDAKNAFLKTGNSEKANEASSYIEEIKGYLEKLREAENYFRTGEKFYKEGEYKKALTSYKEAEKLFLELQDERVETVRERISEINEMMKTSPPIEEQKEPVNLTPIIVLVLVVFLIVVGYLFYKKSLKPKELDVPKKVRKLPKKKMSEREVKEAIRELKAKFVYGEINRKEYQEELERLEEML